MTPLYQNTAARRPTRVANVIRVEPIIGGAQRLAKIIPLIAKKIGYSLLLLAITTTVVAQKPDADLTTTSLEDLMSIEVTSVSKKDEKQFRSAAAVYVITQEEIRRSGLTSIPDLLRRVPGLDVARIDGTKWAVSARGFNGRMANKLLVLIDGRSVFSQETSGVYWEEQDVLLEDVERIEVIRGPGGTLWGANAVNGVINIITKHTRDTQGGLVTTGGGSSDNRGFGSARYGGSLGNNVTYKIDAKYFNRRGLVDAAGKSANDGQQALRGGGRLDWQLTNRDSLTLQGGIYDSNLRETSTVVSPAAPLAPSTNTEALLNGGHILSRWTRTLSKTSDLSLQFYFDRYNRDRFDLHESSSTLDLDFQHAFDLGQRHSFVWGLGYRNVSHRTNSSSANPVQYSPKEKTVAVLNAFVQDEFTLIKDTLRLTVGTKVEHNEYSGFEVQPTARLLWTPSNRQTIWGAVSRAVRPPSRAERDIRINAAAIPMAGGIKALLILRGDESTAPEELRAYELGYRAQPSRKVSFDIATFYSLYNHLTALRSASPFFESDPAPAHLVIPLHFANLMHGETYGVEASATWRPVYYWRLKGGYSFLRVQLHRHLESLDRTAEIAEGQSPRHQLQLHSFLSLPRNFELDSSVYRVSARVADGIPGYTRLDARLGWSVRETVELSLVMQNLLDGRHREFRGISELTSQPTRRAYGKLTWRF